MKPTKEQIKNFWEWCGFTNLVYEQGVWEFRWFYIDDERRRQELPPIDLNSLFQWAIPQLRKDTTQEELLNVLYGWISSSLYYEGDDNSALALFWAIYKLIDPDVVATT